MTIASNVAAVNATANLTGKTSNTSTTGTTSSLQSLANNFTDFISLLTTQLKNQDPTSPTNTDQFTQELIGFSQVQQAVDTNTNLTNLLKATNAAGVNNSISYINQLVQANSNVINLKTGKPVPATTYTLPSNAASVSVAVIDSSGKLVNTISSNTGGLAKGQHTFSWDGTDSNGKAVTDGDYTFSVLAKDANGQTITGITNSVTDYVSSVDFSGGATTLYFGDIPITTDKVMAIKGYYSQDLSSTVGTGTGTTTPPATGTTPSS